MPLDASEANTIRAAVSDAIEKMPGMEKYYAKNKKYCEINTLSDVEKGIGLFDLQGAKYVFQKFLFLQLIIRVSI